MDRIIEYAGLSESTLDNPELYEVARAVISLCRMGEGGSLPLSRVYRVCGYKNLSTAGRVVKKHMVEEHDFFEEDGIHYICLEGLKILTIWCERDMIERANCISAIVAVEKAFVECGYDVPGPSAESCCYRHMNKKEPCDCRKCRSKR